MCSAELRGEGICRPVLGVEAEADECVLCMQDDPHLSAACTAGMQRGDSPNVLEGCGGLGREGPGPIGPQVEMETAEKKGRVAASVLQPGDSWPRPLDEELEEPPRSTQSRRAEPGRRRWSC